MMIGVEIYNENGGLYYSSKNPPKTSLTLYRRLDNYSFRTTPTPPFGTAREYYNTGIPNHFSCLVFSSFRGGDPGAITARKGPDGHWEIYSQSVQSDFEDLSTHTTPAVRPAFTHWYVAFDVYIFSNYQSGPVVPKNQYGVFFYDEQGVLIRDADTKNLNMTIMANSLKNDNLSSYLELGHPVATLSLPVDGIFIPYFYPSAYGYAFGVGKGTRIVKHCLYGSGMGPQDQMDRDWNTIVYINTDHYR